MTTPTRTCSWCGHRRRIEDKALIEIKDWSLEKYICNFCAEAIKSRLEARSEDKLQDKPTFKAEDGGYEITKDEKVEFVAGGVNKKPLWQKFLDWLERS